MYVHTEVCSCVFIHYMTVCMFVCACTCMCHIPPQAVNSMSLKIQSPPFMYRCLPMQTATSTHLMENNVPTLSYLEPTGLKNLRPKDGKIHLLDTDQRRGTMGNNGCHGDGNCWLLSTDCVLTDASTSKSLPGPCEEGTLILPILFQDMKAKRGEVVWPRLHRLKKVEEDFEPRKSDVVIRMRPTPIGTSI